MLLGAILLGLLLGLWAGGRMSNLATIRLRWAGLLFLAVIVRFGTEALLNAGVDIVETLRLPLLLLGFVLLLVGTWVNRGYPGMGIAFVGILSNAIVITINGGYMPVWDEALAAAGMGLADVTSALHVVVPGTVEQFLFGALVLGDIIPIPIPVVQNVVSIGDVFLSLGLGFFLFAGVVRVPTQLEAREEEAIRQRLYGIARSTRLPRPDGHGVAPETGLRRRCRRALRSNARCSSARRPPAWRRRRWHHSHPARRNSTPSSSAWRPTAGRSTRASPSPARRPARRASPSLGPPRRRSHGSADIHTSGSPSTARSQRCGRVSWSRCSATGSTRSPSRRRSTS